MSLNNQVLLMIVEYHLTCASQGTHRVTPILPEVATWLVPPIDEYLSGQFQGCHNVRVTDQTNTLHVATCLHHLDLTTTYGQAISTSPQVDFYDVRPLLEYFMAPKTSDLTFEEVMGTVSLENHCEVDL